MESKEKYFFSSVDFYLQSCKLYDGTKKLMKNGNDGELPSEKSNDGYYLHIDDNLQNKIYLGNLSDAKVYVNIKNYGSTVSPPCVDFQYWFFYPFSGSAKASFELTGKINSEKVAQFAVDKAATVVPQLAAAKVALGAANEGLKKLGVEDKLEKEFKKAGGDKLEKLETITKKVEIDLHPLGKHEGDWEHVTIRVDANLSKIIGVYYSQFPSGKKVLSQFLANTLKMENGHPVIFKSRNGHASYFAEGENLSETKKDGVDTEFAKFKFTFGISNTCSKGTKFDSTDKLEIINAVDLSNNTPLFPLKAPSWLNYQGQWGLSEIEGQIGKTDSFKSVEEMLSKVPAPVVKEVKNKLDSMIPQSYRSLVFFSGPKYMDSFNKNEFA